MNAVMAPSIVEIFSGLPCDHDSCANHTEPLFRQLNVPKYSQQASVMRVPETAAEWRSEHRTARKRAWRAERFGYTFDEVDYSLHSEDIYEINTSLERRQGRLMTDGYTARRNHSRLSEDQTRCPHHRTFTFGVKTRHKLVAYSTVHRAGGLAMVSMILGHGAHLENGIMYLLFSGIVENQAGRGGHYFYNLHSSGTDGLRFFKERCGFKPADLEWVL